MSDPLDGGCFCRAVRYRMKPEPMFVHCCHCLNCQSQTGSAFVRLGSLDDPSALSPDVHIFTRSKLPWVRLPEDVPSFEVYYKTSELWPAESLQRLRAVNG